MLMPSFSYKAVSESGKPVTGVLTAENYQVALRLLEEKALYPVRVNEGVEEFMEPYALDAADSARIDFRAPDKILVIAELASGEVTLQARVKERDGRPVLILEKLNDIPLYIVGGIVSGGVNRGVDKAWEDASVELTSIVVRESRLVYELR